MKLKVLPLTIFTCCLFLGGKALDFAVLGDGQAIAQEKAEESDHGKEEKESSDEKVKIVDEKEEAKDEDAKEEDEEKEEEEASDKGGHGGGHGKKDTKPKLPTGVSYERPQEKIPQFTDTEKEVLQKLADRRAELDAYARDLDLKASLLDASSKKLDDKLAELQSLKSDTEALLKTYNEHEDTKIKSLVKIYENMKPTAAAGIFEQMDMDILLQIIDKMAEKKASLILANMNPAKAKEITQKLADEKSLNNRKNVNSAAKTASAAAPAAANTPALPSQPATAAVAPQPPTSIAPPPAGSAKALAEEKYTESAAQKAAAKDEKPAADKPAEKAESSDKKSEAETSHSEEKPKA